MEAKDKLLPLGIALVVALGLGWWMLKPAPRHTYQVPQAQLDEAKKGKINETKYAVEGEGGSGGTMNEKPGGADEERLGLAAPAQPVQTEEMKARGILPMEDGRIH